MKIPVTFGNQLERFQQQAGSAVERFEAQAEKAEADKKRKSAQAFITQPFFTVEVSGESFTFTGKDILQMLETPVSSYYSSVVARDDAKRLRQSFFKNLDILTLKATTVEKSRWFKDGGKTKFRSGLSFKLTSRKSNLQHYLEQALWVGLKKAEEAGLVMKEYKDYDYCMSLTPAGQELLNGHSGDTLEKSDEKKAYFFK